MCLRTVVGDTFGRSLLRVRVPLLVLGLPGVVNLQPAVELLSAGRQQLDVCPRNVTVVRAQTIAMSKDGQELTAFMLS